MLTHERLQYVIRLLNILGNLKLGIGTACVTDEYGCQTSGGDIYRERGTNLNEYEYGTSHLKKKMWFQHLEVLLFQLQIRNMFNVVNQLSIYTCSSGTAHSVRSGTLCFPCYGLYCTSPE